MRKYCLVFVTVAIAFLPAREANGQLPQVQYIIDKPTAGMMPDRSYMLRGFAGAESSFLVGASVGFKEVIQFGASYGAQNVFDHGNPAINDYPGFQVRVRLLGEAVRMPAIALGFDSQGRGVYHASLERYDRKSTGFYAVASKNFALILGELSLHGGVNWSTEKKDDKDPTVFLATEWVLFQHLSFLLGVDPAFNDNGETSFGKGGFYVDAGVGWYFAEFANVTLAFRDLVDNFAPMPGVSRELQLNLIRSF
jgi:hypothetical protein